MTLGDTSQRRWVTGRTMRPCRRPAYGQTAYRAAKIHTWAGQPDRAMDLLEPLVNGESGALGFAWRSTSVP